MPRDAFDPDRSTDVLVIGAGLAGLFLALKLAPRSVTVIAPRPPGEAAASAWAQGGIAAALGAGDDPEQHLADTLAAGAGLVDPIAARVLCEDGPARVRDLAALGAPFDRDAAGGFILSREAAHGRARVARVGGDGAGAAILSAVAKATLAAPHVTFVDGLLARALLIRADGRIGGAACVDASGARVNITAGETVLALGGIGGLYAVTTNPTTADGAGLALAASVGAVIADAEFVQFHPTALDLGLDPAPLATEALRGEGAILIDRSGAPIVDPLAPRDRVARAIHEARRSGRGAFLDGRAAIGAAFPDHFPGVFATAMKAGFDPRITPLPIAPAAHYHMGGTATDLSGRTSVAGLWAVGECACTGVHGANRLASNSLLEAVVFANRAAETLKGEATPGPATIEPGDLPAVLAPAARRALRDAMATHAGVIRDADGLSRLIETIDGLEAEAPGAPPLRAARLIATAALAREESRGGHFRADFPEPKPQPERLRMISPPSPIAATPASR